MRGWKEAGETADVRGSAHCAGFKRGGRGQEASWGPLEAGCGPHFAATKETGLLAPAGQGAGLGHSGKGPGSRFLAAPPEGPSACGHLHAGPPGNCAIISMCHFKPLSSW